MNRPRIFIVSSAEQIRLAEALAALLSRDLEPTPWWTVFQPGHFALEDLAVQFDSHDFGVVLLGADDVTTSRGVSGPSPRDNAVLELGMLIGVLGRERAFWVTDRAVPVKSPSDLWGATPVTYDGARSDGNLEAALSEAAAMIKSSAKKLGPINRQNARQGVVPKDRVYDLYADHVQYSQSSLDGYLAACYSGRRRFTATAPIRAWTWSIARRSDKDLTFNAAGAPTRTVLNHERSRDGDCYVRDFHKMSATLAFSVVFEPSLRIGESFSIDYEVFIPAHRPSTLPGLRTRPRSVVPTLGEADFTSASISYPMREFDFSIALPRSLRTNNHHLETIRAQYHDQTESDLVTRDGLFEIKRITVPEEAWLLRLRRHEPPVGLTYRLCWTPPDE